MLLPQCCIATYRIAAQYFPANIPVVEDQPLRHGMTGSRRMTSMIFSNLVRNARGRIEKRMRYGRLVAEIQSLTERDLTDIGAARGDMLRHAYLDVYGR
jgi:hypothetical protein